MTQAFVEKSTAIKLISGTIEPVMESKTIVSIQLLAFPTECLQTIYQELDKNQLIQTLLKLLDQVSLQMVISLNDERLTKKVRGVMSIELLSTIFDDFTPEEKEMFNAAVEGRWERRIIY